MKRATVILLVLVVFAALLVSCNNNPSKKNNDNIPDDTKSVFVNPGTVLGDFGTELVSRFPVMDEQFSLETDVMVVSPSVEPDSEAIEMVLAALINDSYVILLDPSYGEWVSFVNQLEVSLLNDISDFDYVNDERYFSNLIDVYDFLCILEENHKNLYFHSTEGLNDNDMFYDAIVMKTDEILFVETAEEENGNSDAGIRITREIYSIDESVDDSEEVLESTEELNPEDSGLLEEIGNVGFSKEVDIEDSVSSVI